MSSFLGHFYFPYYSILKHSFLDSLSYWFYSRKTNILGEGFSILGLGLECKIIDFFFWVVTLRVDYCAVTWLLDTEIIICWKDGGAWLNILHCGNESERQSRSLRVPISQSDSHPTRCSLCYCIWENKAKWITVSYEDTEQLAAG